QVKGQKGGGTGLGLTICKYIVESHLGRIWAEWRANKGAKFVFTFPLNLKKDEFGRIFKE
ncbi:MAG: ATP-binding protein, partial [Elusimicrobiales bacterium]